MMRRQTDFDKVQDSCFLSRWLQLHCFKHFFRSLSRPLQTSDLFNLDPSLYPETNIDNYQRKMATNRQFTISSLVNRLLFVLAGILAIIGAGLTFTGPLVIKKIMSLLKSPRVAKGEQLVAYSYLAAWMGLYLLRIFINQYADRMFFLQAVKAEQILTSEILKKISRLSPTIRRTNILNYFTNDIKLIFNFIKSCAGIFGSVSTLVFVQIFLLLEVGRLGLVLIGVFLLVGAVQRYLYGKMSKVRNKKMSLVSERIRRNIELFSSIKQLKLLGWQELIIQKDKVYREGVDRYNNTYFTYNNIFDLVINLTPTFVFLAVLVLQRIVETRFKFDIAEVYVVLAFAGLTYGPSKSLLNNVINTADAYSSISKVNELLGAQEIVLNKTKDPIIKPGEIKIDNLVASYDSHFIYNSEHLDSERNLIREEETVNQRKRLLEEPEEKDIIEGFVVRVPFEIKMRRGDKLILLGQPNAGKTELMQTILGNLNIISGEASYNGKIGYLPQKLWFQNTTARNNITFGEPINSQKLGKIYRMLGIEDQMSLLNKADLTMMSETSNISDGQKRRIALGRVLYSDPDIMLLDEVFGNMDQQTITLVYGSLRKHYYDRTIIISTHLTSFIRSSDKVLLMKDGSAVEYGTYEELFQDQQSYIHKLLDQDDNAKDDNLLLRKQLKFEKRQRDESVRKKASRKHRLGHFVKGLIAMTKGLSRDEIQQKLKLPVKSSQIRQVNVAPPAKRGETVSIAYYWRFFRSAPISLYALLFIVCLFAQTVKVLSDVWIGSLNKLPWKMDEHSALMVYVGMTVVFGLLLALAGCLSPYVSVMNSNFIGDRLRKALAYARLSWFEAQGTTKASTRLGRDSEEIFLINVTIQNMFKNSLMFFATIIMVGVGSQFFLLLATAIIILNITILYYFMRTERQMKALGAPYNPSILKTYNDTIQGIDQLRAFNKVDWCLNNFSRDLYNYTVCKVNYKYIYNGMSIACELSSLVIIAAAAIIAVNSKFNKETEDIAVIGTSISFSLRMTGIVTSFIRDALGLELAMKGSSKKNFDIIDRNPVNSQILPRKPAGWPQDNSVQFEKVSIAYEGYDEPTVKEVDFTINSGENVVVWGKDGSGKSSLLSAMCKLVVPVKNIDESLGCVKIAGYDIGNIGNKYITQNNMLLGPVPFLYTATLRDNMDPFASYSDREIQRCLEQVELWDEIRPHELQSANFSKLAYVLTDAGVNLNLGLQQKLNIARALLYKPNILLLESATSCLDERTEEVIERLLRQQLKKSTICAITQQIDTTMESDKVIYMSRGRVKEIGVPMELLKNPESNLSKLVKNTSPELYIKKVVSRVDSTGSIGGL